MLSIMRFLLVGLFFMFFAGQSVVICQTASPTSGVTPGGFRFVNHTAKQGSKMVIGELALLNVWLYQDSMLIGCTVQEGGPVTLPLMPVSEADQFQRPILEGMALMSVGDSISLFWDVDSIVAELDPELKNAKFIRYDMVLLDIIDSVKAAQLEAEAMREEQAMLAAMNAIKEAGPSFIARVKPVADSMAMIVPMLMAGTAPGMKTTDSGIKYVIVRPTTGKIAGGNAVGVVHYYGTLTDGLTRFDDSFSRGEPFPLQIGVGMVIPGWDELLKGVLPEGCSAIAIIPSALAYGQNPDPDGPIKPGDDLAFFIEPIVYGKLK
jgi:FKBP-type peptidyl-prolyl cis-trans isomerase